MHSCTDIKKILDLELIAGVNWRSLLLPEQEWCTSSYFHLKKALDKNLCALSGKQIGNLKVINLRETPLENTASLLA